MNPTALLKLMRISAWPTLLSNVLAAWWLTENASGRSAAPGLLPLLLLTGTCFYLAGMVLNDFFDVGIDARERPERPIPSGAVSRTEAGLFGFFLLFCGLIGTEICVAETESMLLRGVGWILAALIVGYDAFIKRIPVIGAAAMGCCRFFMILFVIVAVGALTHVPEAAGHFGHISPWLAMPHRPWETELMRLSWPVCYGFGILSYIFGITIISGYEAGLPEDRPLDLKRKLSIWCAAGIAVLGLLIPFAPILSFMTTGHFTMSLHLRPLTDVLVVQEPDFSTAPWNMYLTFLFASLPLVLLWKAVPGLLRPTPVSVRKFVGTGLALLIPIDAVCCLVYVGAVPALLILALFPLAMLLRRVVPMS